MLEQKLQHNVLYFPCRQHIMELIIGAAFEKTADAGGSSGPEIKLFKRFRDQWEFIDKESFFAAPVDDYVDAVVSNAASRVYFLKQLKRAGIPIRDLLHFYTAIVRLVLEYACPVWHSGLTVGQCNAIENIQKRAIRVVYSDTDSDYEIALIVAGMDSLKDRREKLMARFFKRQVLASNALLHYLLPERRDNDTIRSPRNSQPFPSIRARTNKFYKSFLPYCLKNFT